MLRLWVRYFQRYRLLIVVTDGVVLWQKYIESVTSQFKARNTSNITFILSQINIHYWLVFFVYAPEQISHMSSNYSHLKLYCEPHFTTILPVLQTSRRSYLDPQLLHCMRWTLIPKLSTNFQTFSVIFFIKNHHIHCSHIVLWEDYMKEVMFTSHLYLHPIIVALSHII